MNRPRRIARHPGALGEVERVSWLVIGYLIASTDAPSAPVYGYLGNMLAGAS